MSETTENTTTKEVEVIISSPEGHWIAGKHYKQGDKASVSPKRREKLKARGVIQ